MSRRRVMSMLLRGITEATREFIARVELDNGRVESARCIAKKLRK